MLGGARSGPPLILPEVRLPELRLELGEAARRRARRFKVSAMAARLNGVYRELLAERDARVAAA